MLRSSVELYLRAQGFLRIELDRAAVMLPPGWALDREHCTCRPSAHEGSWVASLSLTSKAGRSIQISSGVRRSPEAASAGAIEAIGGSLSILQWLGHEPASPSEPGRSVQATAVQLPRSAITPLRPLLAKRGHRGGLC